MEDSDSARDADSEMAEYHDGADFSDDVDPNAGHSGIGNRIPRFPVSGGISRFPIPDWRIENREKGLLPGDSAGTVHARESWSPDWESGSGGRHDGDFLV